MKFLNEYVLEFFNGKREKDRIVTCYCFNGYTSVRYNNDFSFVAYDRSFVKGDIFCEVCYLLCYYLGMGYKLIDLRHNRLAHPNL